MGGFCDGGVRSGTSFSQKSADGRHAVRVLFICVQVARWQIVDMSTRTAVVLRNLCREGLISCESPHGVNTQKTAMYVRLISYANCMIGFIRCILTSNSL